MEFITAKEAREISESILDNLVNESIETTFIRIKSATKMGQFQCDKTFARFLTKQELSIFKDKGYKIYKDSNDKRTPRYTIEW